jgi:hypothetical protein
MLYPHNIPTSWYVVKPAGLGSRALPKQGMPDSGAAQIETDFLMGMVPHPHHRSAVGMAQMAAEKATHQGLEGYGANHDRRPEP